MTATAPSAFGQDNLVSSRVTDDALLLDTNFINAWGIALRPAGAGGHWWVTNTDTSRVTLYVGDSPTVPFTTDSLSVLAVPGATGAAISIPIDPPTRDGTPLAHPTPTPVTMVAPSNPTGQVFSGSTTDFLVDATSLTGTALNDAPARFITVSEDGTIAAWGEAGPTPAQRADAFEVVVDNSAPDANGIHAIYKGVTVSAESGSGNLLFAANFSQNRIDVFDAQWQPVIHAGFAFTAPGGRDPAAFAPFNIERVFDASRGEDVLIVVYAKVANAAGGEEESTDGFIVKFTVGGDFIAATDAGGAFNAPWGVAVAPAEWGDFDGDLLIGNFGDGRILGLDIATLQFDGFLLDDAGVPVVIDGLWDLAFGNGASLGAVDRLYFAAGPEEESQGLFGSLSVLGDANQKLDGSAGADRLSGGTGNDLIRGGAGNDRLNGRAGDDTLLGGLGDDVLMGGLGDDTLRGGEAQDRLDGGDGEDRLHGNDGDDTLLGGQGRDRLMGGAGRDSLDGGAGDDGLHGGDGDDSLAGGIGADDLVGDAGQDSLEGDAGDDILRGGEGQDDLDGGEGDDRLHGDGGEDKLFGGEGHDRLRGGAGRDSLDGGTGDDALDGGNDDDSLAGGTGDDRMFGDQGQDSLDGGAGDDRLYGGTDSDMLAGGAGRDRLDGQDGRDILFGGGGADVLTGGLGADLFVFAALSDSTAAETDWIADYRRGEGDWINLSVIDAQAGLEGDQAFAFVGTGDFLGGGVGSVRLRELATHTQVLVDTGDGGAAEMMFRIGGVDGILASDFIL